MPLHGEAFAGEYEPVTLAAGPAAGPGQGDRGGERLERPGGDDPRRRDRRGLRLVPHQPRDHGGSGLHDHAAVRHARRRGRMPKEITRRFWLTVKTPADGQAGHVSRHGDDSPGEGQSPPSVPVVFRVRAGTLDPVDIPAGPFSYTIGLPWYERRPEDRRVQSPDDAGRACGRCANMASPRAAASRTSPTAASRTASRCSISRRPTPR